LRVAPMSRPRAAFLQTASAISRTHRRAILAAAILVGAAVAPGASAMAQQTVTAAEPSASGAAPADEQSFVRPTRQIVSFQTDEAAGTIIIDTKSRFLYLVQPARRAIRYGVGVGRDGFRWTAEERISRKEEWPDWRPPQDMLGRQPYLPRFMAGGDGNPTGARALYFGRTVFRIHGANSPETIGQAVSSGCIRLVNEDVIDLYNRVQVGTKVIVKQSAVLAEAVRRRRLCREAARSSKGGGAIMRWRSTVLTAGLGVSGCVALAAAQTAAKQPDNLVIIGDDIGMWNVGAFEMAQRNESST